MKVTVTSASRREQNMLDVAAAVYVISHDDIQRSGLTSVPDLLRLAPGVEVARIDANKWAISVRGFNFRYSNKLLVLIDGRTIYNRVQSGVFWNMVDLPVELVDRIEVIRGPGGSIWGANAVDGVINVITKAAGDTRGGTVRTGAGMLSHQDVFAQYSGTAVGALYRVYGQWFDRGYSLLRDTRAPAGDDSQSTTGGFRLDWTGISHDFTVQGEASTGDHGTNAIVIDGPMPPAGGWQPSTQTGNWYAGNLLAKWTRIGSDHSSLRVQAFVDRLHLRDPNAVNDEATTVDVDLTYQVKTGRHNLVSGAEFRSTHDRVPGNFDFSVTPDTQDLVTSNLFGQDEISLPGDRVLLTLGSKLEHDTLGGWGLQPTARALWRVDSRQRVWTAVSRVWRTPARVDRGMVVHFYSFLGPEGLPLTLGLVGNPAYESEELRGLEAGYRVDVSPALSFDVATFANHYNGLQTLDPQAPTFEIQDGQAYLYIAQLFGNNQRADTRGIEATSAWRPIPWWQLQGSVGGFHFSPHPLAAATDPDAATADGNAPAYQWQIRSGISIGSRLEWNTSVFGVGRLRVREVPAYTRTDVQFTWKATPHVSVSAAGQNLFGAGHTEFLGQDTGSTPTLSSRTAGVRLSWRF